MLCFLRQSYQVQAGPELATCWRWPHPDSPVHYSVGLPACVTTLDPTAFISVKMWIINKSTK